MPRAADYWRARAMGKCVECPTPSPHKVRCDACMEKRRRKRFLRTGRKGGVEFHPESIPKRSR